MRQVMTEQEPYHSLQNYSDNRPGCWLLELEAIVAKEWVDFGLRIGPG